jgi:hypothetical protein
MAPMIKRAPMPPAIPPIIAGILGVVGVSPVLLSLSPTLEAVGYIEGGRAMLEICMFAPGIKLPKLVEGEVELGGGAPDEVGFRTVISVVKKELL